MTPPGYVYYRRAFLNRAGTYAGAYVLATVSEHSAYGHITISDCDRIMRLEFDQSDPHFRRNTLRKVDLLIDTFTGFRAALVEADADRRDAGVRRRRDT
jgi:hypothetical protein